MMMILKAGMTLAVLLAGAGAVWAGEVSLSYRAQTHILALQSHPVGSDINHVIGVAAFEGQAEFQDETAEHGYAGQLELTGSGGTIRGYAHWSFDDGSYLTAQYQGVIHGGADVDFEAKFAEIQGGGRFAGAMGTGVFSGRRTGEIADGGRTEINGNLMLILPD